MSRRGIRRSQRKPLGTSKEVPEQVSGLIGWWRADSGVETDSGNVVNWESKVGGYTVTQGTAGNRPAFNATDSNFNNEPTISFDPTGSADFLGLTDAGFAGNFDSGSSFTVFIVMRATDIGSQRTAWCISDFNVSNDLIRIGFVNASGNVRMQRAENGATQQHDDSSAPISAATSHYQMAGYDGTTSYMSTDGSTRDTATLNTRNPDGCDRWTIGARDQNGADSQHWKGEIAEIIVYNNLVSTASQSLVEGYLASRYGI